MMPVIDEVYLGDGLYARFDGYQIILRAPRIGGDHWVALEMQVFDALLAFEKTIVAAVEAELKK
jgi:hypothetical protein